MWKSPSFRRWTSEPRRRAILPVVLAAASVVALALWTRPFFPTPNGTMGHDWSYFLPLLLAGRYWIEANGLLVPPTFTPAFCGGLPLLANPQSVFYSLPQALTLWLNPIDVAFLTLVLSAAGGALGCYLLLRGRFGVSREGATFVAVAFLFNGFLVFRVIIGQPHFHSFALVPWIAYAALVDPGDPKDRVRWTARLLFASGWVGLATAYFVFSGSANILVPAGLCVLAIWLVHAVYTRPRHSFWLVGGFGALLGAAISAANLVPTYVFMETFPRPYGINMFDGAARAIRWLAQGMFLAQTLPEGGEFGRRGVGFRRSEAEFGVTIVPLIVIGWGLWRALRTRGRPLLTRRRIGYGLPLVVLLGLPFLMNVHIAGEAWHDLLNRVPYVRSNVQFMRWWFVYIPVTLVAAGIAFDRVFGSPRGRVSGMLAGVGAIVLLNLVTDMTHYAEEPYDPVLVARGWEAVREGASPPTVGWVGEPPDAGARGERTFVNDRNDRLATGVSAFPCYEPLFGYMLEIFPDRWPLEEGPATRISDGRFNLRNPACYIYGPSNQCAPGDHFTAEEAEAVADFTRYRPFPYERPAWQDAARATTAVGLLLALLCLIWGPILAVIARRRHN
jgi:hypothetical protein